MSKKERVIVAMSGGVDSSVAAALLVEAGYECIGITMQLWSDDLPKGKNNESGCCSLSAVEDARRVANKLGIPYYVLNFSHAFAEEVIAQFTADYMRGRTPNPCIVCNERVKFGTLLRKAQELDARYVATGHYARVGYDERYGRYVVRRGVDRKKDQSYTMHGLTQEQLSHMLTPVGEYNKEQIREMARSLDLITATKPDSQEICFVPDGDYKAFMREVAPESLKEGLIVNTKGEVLGKHQGIAYYTIGQRRGLGIAADQPLYVVELDAETNRVIVGTADEVLGDALIADGVNWVAWESLNEPREVECQIRYHAPASPATIIPMADGRVEVRFHTPQRAITPGQRVVWYEGDVVVGGGTIVETRRVAAGIGGEALQVH